MRQLVASFNEDGFSPEERAAWGRRLADLPSPSDALPNLPPAGSQGAAMPFRAGDHAPLVSQATHRIHWERHYAVYAGRAAAAADALNQGDLTIATPSSEAALATSFWNAWLGLLLHQEHWCNMTCDDAALERATSRRADWLPIAQDWDASLPATDGIVLIHESPSTGAAVGTITSRFSQNFAALPSDAVGRPILALDLFRHAWFFDGDRASWIASWLALVEANGAANADLLERAATAPTTVASDAEARTRAIDPAEASGVVARAIDAPSLGDRAAERAARFAPAGVASLFAERFD